MTVVCLSTTKQKTGAQSEEIVSKTVLNLAKLSHWIATKHTLEFEFAQARFAVVGLLGIEIALAVCGTSIVRERAVLGFGSGVSRGYVHWHSL